MMNLSPSEIDILSDKILAALKDSNRNLSYSQAVEVLENTIERVKTIPLKFPTNALEAQTISSAITERLSHLTWDELGKNKPEN